MNIVGIGIDIIEIKRFAHWAKYSNKVLQRFLSTAEVAYCLQDKKLSAERFAARFAAKEALFKAVSARHQCSLRALARASNTLHLEHAVDWKSLGIPNYTFSLSISHTENSCVAIAIITE